MKNHQAYAAFNEWCKEKNADEESRLFRCTKYLTDTESKLLEQAMQFAFVAGYTYKKNNEQANQEQSTNCC